MAYQISGDAYTRLHRHEDATRSYQEACYEFKKILRSSNSSKIHNASLGPVEEARLLRKLGRPLGLISIGRSGFDCATDGCDGYGMI